MTMFKVTLTASGRRTPHFDTFRLNVTWQGTVGIDSGNFWHHRTQLVSTHTKLCSCRQDLGRKGSLGGDGPTGFRQLKGRFVKPDDLLVNINFFFDHLIILNERIQSLRSHDLFRIQVNIVNPCKSKISAGEILFVFAGFSAATNPPFFVG